VPVNPRDTKQHVAGQGVHWDKKEHADGQGMWTLGHEATVSWAGHVDRRPRSNKQMKGTKYSTCALSAEISSIATANDSPNGSGVENYR
jgi:hypothetical protein